MRDDKQQREDRATQLLICESLSLAKMTFTIEICLYIFEYIDRSELKRHENSHFQDFKEKRRDSSLYFGAKMIWKISLQMIGDLSRIK